MDSEEGFWTGRTRGGSTTQVDYLPIPDPTTSLTITKQSL